MHTQATQTAIDRENDSTNTITKHQPYKVKREWEWTKETETSVVEEGVRVTLDVLIRKEKIKFSLTRKGPVY